MKGLWKRIRYRLEWMGLRVAVKLVPLLSRRSCFEFGGWAGRVAARFDRKGRRVALSNLEVAFGDEFSSARREEMVRESYEHFARTMLDLLWSPRLTRENYGRYVEFQNEEQLRADISSSVGCVLGAFHYGNFEWLSLAYAWSGFPSAIITQEFKNPLLDPFFQRLREQSGHKTVPREGAIVRLYKTLRKGGLVALLVDTTVPPSQPTVVIECFGLKTIVTVAHAWLQERTGSPIMPVYSEPLGGGRYRVITLPAVQPPEGATHQEIAQACWDAFEPVVRRNPAPWLWMYKHWRYRPVASEREYPFYAQESLEFEQIASRPNYAKLDREPIMELRERVREASGSGEPPGGAIDSGWKALRYGCESLIVRAVAAVVPRLPRRLSQRLADLVGAAASVLHLPGRAIALSNVEAAFPELPSAQKKELVRKSYQCFARAMADLFWSPRLNPEDIPQILDLQDLERLKRQRSKQEGVIFACLHYGGFEWIAYTLARSGFQCTVVTQPFKNRRLNATFDRLRKNAGYEIIRRKGAMLRLYKGLRAGRSVTLAVDLTLSAKLPSVPIKCFGMQTCVTFAHAWLHKRAGAPIIPAHCEPLPDGRYRVVLHPQLQIAPDATDRQIAQACWDCFEPVIRRNPAPWLWMYKHWRYRPANARHRYPRYANESPHFRKLLACAESEMAAISTGEKAAAGALPG